MPLLLFHLSNTAMVYNPVWSNSRAMHLPR